MHKYLLLFYTLLCSTLFGQTYQWVNLSTPDYPYNPAYLKTPVTVDNSGNPVCARLIQPNSGSYGDIKLEKRNPSGSLLWENIIYGKAEISELVVDAEDNIICIGTFIDSVVIGTTTLYQTWVTKGSFIFKTTASGSILWVIDAVTFAPQYSVIDALGVNASNNILVGATNYNTNANIYVISPTGDLVSTILQTGAGTISDINVDVFGNIWATGFSFNHNISFNGLDTIAPFSYNEYVVKYNSSGTAQWVSFIEDITVQEFNIETDNSGNAYLSGNLFAPTQFGNLTANGPQWVYDFFVTKISPDGNYLWLNEIPPGNNQGDATIGNSNFMSCSNDGTIYLTGFFRGVVNFSNSVTLSAMGSNDQFVISYNSDGEVQWAKAAGSGLYDQGSGIVTDNNGSCYVSGTVSQNAIFDTISVSGGDINLFLAKLTFDTPVNVEDVAPDNVSLPDEFLLMQNYPNPFNPSTVIIYQLPVSSEVTLKVYDVLGNEVATLVNEEKTRGTYEINFDASGLSSGIYFYTIRAGKFSESKKMILLR